MQSPHLYSVALREDQLFYEMFKQFLQSSPQVWIRPLGEFWTWNTDKMRWYFNSNLTLIRPCSQSTHGGQTFNFSIKWSIKIRFLYWNNNVPNIKVPLWEPLVGNRTESTQFFLSRKSISFLCIVESAFFSTRHKVQHTRHPYHSFPSSTLPASLLPRLEVNFLTWTVRFLIQTKTSEKEKKS